MKPLLILSATHRFVTRIHLFISFKFEPKIKNQKMLMFSAWRIWVNLNTGGSLVKEKRRNPQTNNSLYNNSWPTMLLLLLICAWILSLLHCLFFFFLSIFFSISIFLSPHFWQTPPPPQRILCHQIIYYEWLFHIQNRQKKIQWKIGNSLL